MTFKTNLFNYVCSYFKVLFYLNAPPFCYCYKLDFQVFGMCPNNNKNNKNKNKNF